MMSGFLPEVMRNRKYGIEDISVTISSKNEDGKRYLQVDTN